MILEKNKYCLHDCVINKIEIKNSNLLLYFNDGIYELDQCTNCFKLKGKCNMIIQINNLVEEESYEHITVHLYKKNVRKNICFSKFCELIKKNSFRIYLDFYSSFAQGLLIKGYIYKYEIELIITEIKEMQFIFDN